MLTLISKWRTEFLAHMRNPKEARMTMGAYGYVKIHWYNHRLMNLRYRLAGLLLSMVFRLIYSSKLYLGDTTRGEHHLQIDMYQRFKNLAQSRNNKARI